MADINNSKLLQINAGILKKNACVVIVRTEWNAGIVDELEAGCVRQLKQSGLADIKVIIVPGAFEIAFAIKSYWEQSKKKDRPDAFIALGCVLRGDTPHFDYVAGAAAEGSTRVSLDTGVPVLFGVITADNIQQATDRAGKRTDNKGFEAAMAAIEVVNLYKEVT